MNSLALRISKGGGKKTKNIGGFAPVDVSKFISESLGADNNIKSFLKAETAEEQLQCLRTCLSEESVGENLNVIRFLVKVFFNAEAKHPVKCFLVKQITKNLSLHQPFTDVLSQELKYAISTAHNTCKDYISVVSKLATCIENFQAGSAAVKIEELNLCKYLNACVTCCVDTLKTQSLSPTEKNEIFNLSHLALRLLLHIIQRISPENASKLNLEFSLIKNGIQELLFDHNVPMDTKSVCGILFVTVYLMENGQEAWIDILHPTKDSHLTTLLSNEASLLALYSAVATITAMEVLQSQTIDGEASLIVLCKKLLEIGERCSTEPVFTLGVTRTVVQISKQMDKLNDRDIGVSLVGNLLPFVWGHLEHYMDSVRHLTAQMLSSIAKYCSKLDKDGHPEALNNLFASLNSLDRSSKSYFVSITVLANERGTDDVLNRLNQTIIGLIMLLDQQAVQASVTAALETLLQNHVKESTTPKIYSEWFCAILDYVERMFLDPVELPILENLLAKAVKLDDNLIELIKQATRKATETRCVLMLTETRCVLMLLNVARKSGAISRLAHDADYQENPDDERPLWKGLIPYTTLESAAGHQLYDSRILSLSLIVESPKTTEMFSQGELNFILYFLKYNINARSPNLRQIMLSLLKKFMKRLEDSFKVVRKQNLLESEYLYLSFVQRLRELCFNSLLPGVSYGRRVVALQVLAWCEQMALAPGERIWTEEYVEKLLLHLEDSYEANKVLALDILNKCPTELLTIKKYSISLQLADILKQASALKPTECVSAAYKLDLLLTKLPGRIVAGRTCNAPLPAALCLVHALAAALRAELATCERGGAGGGGEGGVARAALDAPMYGVLHCMVHLVGKIDVRAISPSAEWRSLFADVVSLSVRASAAVGGVVNSASPEGHLPDDGGGGGEAGDAGATGDHNTGCVTLADGRLVTAQMVLLCAWRTVKEASLLLGAISSRLLISEEDGPVGTLAPADLVLMGEHFTRLLAETKHRGAFEQAYVGFTQLLSRLWRCRSPSLHALPARWLRELMALIAGGDSAPRAVRAPISTTRRGAGLPFIIQALVTTELQVNGHAKCFHDSMTTLLRLARTPKTPSNLTGESEIDSGDKVSKLNDEKVFEERDALTPDASPASDVETRTHSLNILRALFRHAALHESVAGYVGEGLEVALEGFGGSCWMERNASTLLFSALMVRVFGVQRSRADALCTRNRMTGRIFFLRYPRLYDFMLSKLQAASAGAGVGLRPALFPTLLLLARLYPSALEGTASSLKLAAFVPGVRSCAGGAALLTRRLAARALVPLLAPHDYKEYIISALAKIYNHETRTNECHGLLLQIRELLGAMPRCHLESDLSLQYEYYAKKISSLFLAAGAPLAGTEPCYCYPLADEWIKIINLFIWKLNLHGRFDSIEKLLEDLIYSSAPNISLGREICLSNAVYLHFILKIERDHSRCCIKLLSHEAYEVTLATLNVILQKHRSVYRWAERHGFGGIMKVWYLYYDWEPENDFEKHVSEVYHRQCNPLPFSSDEFIHALCDLLKRTKYLECKQKALELLVLAINSGKYNIIVGTKINNDEATITDDLIVNTLTNCLESENESLTHLYLEIVSEFVHHKLKESNMSGELLVGVLRTMFGFGRCDSSERCRLAVVGFMENIRMTQLLKLDGLTPQDKFEFKTTLYATLVVLLEDDSDKVHRKIATVITRWAESMNMWRPAVEGNNLYRSCILPTKAAEILVEIIKSEEDQAAMLITVAILDFKSQVCLSDESSDEGKVFDQNEKYNVHAEESIWTDTCANALIIMCRNTLVDPIQFVLNLINKPPYKDVIEKLCNQNVDLFVKLTKNEKIDHNVNPKIRLFYDKLRTRSVTETRTVSQHNSYLPPELVAFLSY